MKKTLFCNCYCLTFPLNTKTLCNSTETNGRSFRLFYILNLKHLIQLTFNTTTCGKLRFGNLLFVTRVWSECYKKLIPFHYSNCKDSRFSWYWEWRIILVTKEMIFYRKYLLKFPFT